LMRAVDVDPSRIAAAKAAGQTFIDRVPDRLRLGFVGYSQTPTIVQRPTTEHEAVRAALESLVADGGTATGEAIDAALNTLTERGQRGQAPAAIVLLSDGKSTDGRDPVEIARRARRMKVPIYTVALGTPTGTIEVPNDNGQGTRSEPVPPDPAALREIAQITGGQTFTADAASELDAIYERLGSQVAMKDEKREVTAAFAGGALLLLVVGALLSLRWFGRLP
jgi:Ca-activated chloride channel homolog